MKKFILAFVVGVFSVGSSFAADIQDLKVLTTGSETVIQWTALAEESLFGVDGYALQWSDSQTEIANDKAARQFLQSSQSSLAIRSAGLEYNREYYFRVYTYRKEGRKTILGNGSQILKWKKLFNGEVETNYFDASDANVSEAVTSGANEEFGHVRVTRYDTYAVFAWSRPNLASSEYDGFSLVMASGNNFSNPLVTTYTGKNDFKGRINGLTPATEYYVRGYFYKTTAGEKVLFGAGNVKSFKTSAKFTEAQLARMDRLRKMGRVKDRVSPTATVWLPGTEESATAAATTTTTTTSTSSSTATASSTGMKGASRDQVKARISEVEKQIRTLQVELRRLQTDLRKASGTSASRASSRTTSRRTSSSASTSRSSRTSSRESLVERLKRLRSR